MAVNTVHVVGAKIAFLPTLLYNLIRSRIDRNWYDRIDHTIVLGALPFFSTARKLAEEEGVKGVISLNQEYELKYLSPTAIQWDDLGVKQLKIPTLDFDAAPSIQEIQKGIDFINYYREKNQSVYIHCKAGRGRSALLVTCYLIQLICSVILSTVKFSPNAFGGCRKFQLFIKFGKCVTWAMEMLFVWPLINIKTGLSAYIAQMFL
eukprot:gene16632-8065_t